MPSSPAAAPEQHRPVLARNLVQLSPFEQQLLETDLSLIAELAGWGMLHLPATQRREIHHTSGINTCIWNGKLFSTLAVGIVPLQESFLGVNRKQVKLDARLGLSSFAHLTASFEFLTSHSSLELTFI